jgi:hypothetical protein
LRYSTLLIEESYKALTKEQQQLIKMGHPREFNHLFSNKNGVQEYYPQLVVDLCNDNIVFDHSLCEIHFNNGYVNLNTLEFKERVLNEHFITQFIARDYIRSTQDQRDDILTHIHKVYSSDDLDCILSFLGSALSGKSTTDQHLLFLLGNGSSGKSFIMSLTKETVECYLKELQSDTFCQSNTKIDKILNSYISAPQIRISWVNEMKDSKIDDSLFKSFCDGQLQTTQLYKDGQSSFRHYSIPIFTSNNMPNLKVDSGIIRRLNSYTHKSKFVDDADEVDESNHIYLKDSNLLQKLKDQNLLDAWFDILAFKCHKWLHGEKLRFNKNFNESKHIIIDSNDIIQDFIDSKLTITDDPEDRIGKIQIHDAFNKMYPTKHLTTLQLITALKEKKLKYESKWRCDKIQGCFVGIKLCNDPNDIKYDLDRGISNNDEDAGIDYKAEYLKMKQRCEELEAENKRLNQLMNFTNLCKIKTKTKI